MKMFLCLLLCALPLVAETKYAADVTVLVADLKYSSEHGVKICEVQHGILSTFLGDVYLHGDLGKLSPKVADYFAQFNMPKWMARQQVNFQPLVDSLLLSPDWHKRAKVQDILSDPEFLKAAKQAPDDPADIFSYHGMVWAAPHEAICREEFPGIVVLDAASHPFWVDKFKMSLLFTQDPALHAVKPEWALYTKSVESTMQIVEELPSDCYVLKPRGAFLGNGVIIVERENLQSTLEYILTPSDELKQDVDKSYSYWSRDKFESFLVEKYYPSDLIEYNEKLYEPTMRVVFICSSINHQVDVQFLGGYWILPNKAIDEPGTLNETKKAYCKPPLFAEVDADVLEQVQDELLACLPLFYRQMLLHE